MNEGTNEDKVYKVNHADVREEIRKEVAENLEKFKDPVVLGVLISRLLEERENTNRILKNLIARIEQLEGKQVAKETPMLPKVDEGIVAFLREGPKTAEDVRKQLNYKGKNAASARLNRLHNLGVVVKKHVGKQVYFMLA
ncbi:winged helix-turn-helix domain-containing protein [Candidatus Micrarchaeota archaeon]|nr:winged helix-turn-helix domain-containing protein [Candidatus Micrarchaeota archaeon]